MSIPGYNVIETVYKSKTTLILRAVHKRHHTPVMIKTSPNPFPGLNEISKLHHEYRLLRNFHDEGVVQALELSLINNSPAIIMSDIGGESLAGILKRQNRFSTAEFIDISLRITKIIGNIHKHNIIHKDITPENIVWNREKNRLMVIDFGISAQLSGNINALKSVNAIEGTAAYISPEQTGRMNRDVDYRSDFYSLGVTFFELITGQRPFPSNDVMELIHCHIAKLPPSPQKIYSAVPNTVSNIIMKLMAKNEEDRYQSAYGLQVDLEKCLLDLKTSGTISTFAPGQLDISKMLKISQKIYGRKHETDALSAAYQRVQSGATELMLFSGPSGIGKSFLINEIHKPILTHHGYFISGKFERFKKDTPYSAIRQAFAQLVEQLLNEDQDRITAWKYKILSAVNPNGKVITDVLPHVEQLIGKQPDISPMGPAETENRFNIVLRAFINIFACKEHPLVIFIDDLQWTDSGSLQILKLFLTDTDIRHLFIIGAYRHNDLFDTHPLTLFLAEVKASKGVITDIPLTPLTVPHISELLADTLKQEKSTTASLAQLLAAKTAGNPFFTKEFIQSLYQKGLLKFTYDYGWHWDMEKIRRQHISDNVIDLMAEKITQLSQSAQKILKIGACIGVTFPYPTLVNVSDTSDENLRKALQEIIFEGLIYASANGYRFVHDRVQEAVYSLIAEPEKSKWHYHIGAVTLENTAAEEFENTIFFIVDQLNAALSHHAPSDPLQLIELNLVAGEKALTSNAYRSALNYLKIGIGLLSKTCWEKNYDLALKLHHTAATAAQRCSDDETLELLSETVIKHARTILDTIPVYESKIFALQARNQLHDAIDVGIWVLGRLGFRVPLKPNLLHIGFEFMRTKRALFGKSTQDLLDIPKMVDPHQIGTFRMLASIGTSTYFTNPELLTLLVFKSIQLSLKYGNTSYTAISYTAFGMIHCSILGNIDAGYDYGKLALRLVEKYDFQKVKPRTLTLSTILTLHWKNPLQNLVTPLIKSYETALEMGDLEFTSMSASTLITTLLYSGKTLDIVEKESLRYIETIRKFKQLCPSFYALLQTHQYIFNLRSISKHPTKLIGPIYDETQMRPRHQHENDETSLGCMYGYKTMLCYLFEDYEDALINIEQTESYLKNFIGRMPMPIIIFFSSLVRLALYPAVTRPKQLMFMLTVIRNQKKIKKWAAYAPENNSHKFHLVEAEKARVLGNEKKAKHHYQLGLTYARENGIRQDEALAKFLTAKFWLEQNQEDVAAYYMEKARNTYYVYGAHAIATHIERKYHRLLSLSSESFTAGKTEKNTYAVPALQQSSYNIDIATVLKTSQALSSQTDLGRLLTVIMKLSLKNAGAQRGFLILENEEDHELYIEASCETDAEVIVFESIPVKKTNRLSKAIVNYVNETGETTVLANAQKAAMFVTDPYIRHQDIKSLLCSPIMHKAKRAGIIYLENNISSNAFTQERLELLNMLSTQAAISIQNAILLKHRENTVKLEHEMEIAANIQAGLLPKNPSMAGYGIAVYMAPADDVGGDYYDIIHTHDKDWVIIGDVSGHGIPAGLIMMMVQTSIHTILFQNPNISPSALFETVNRIITQNIKQLSEDKYMTLMVLAAHPGGRFDFCGLHQNIMIHRATTNSVEIVETQGIWIGITNDIKGMIDTDSVTLQKGDTMFLYTDGIAEAWRVNQDEEKHAGHMFGIQKLMEIFKAAAQDSINGIKHSVLNALKEYDCDDDVTMLFLRRED